MRRRRVKQMPIPFERELPTVVLPAPIAEDLVKATAGQTGERIEKVRAKAEESLRAARNRLQIAGKTVQEGTREAVQSVNEQVHQNPWTAVGIAAGVGLLIGILLGRR